MGKRDDGGQAFPVQTYLNPNNGTMEWGNTGMTLRQWYKGMIAARVMETWAECDPKHKENTVKRIGEWADALIAEDRRALWEALKAVREWSEQVYQHDGPEYPAQQVDDLRRKLEEVTAGVRERERAAFVAGADWGGTIVGARMTPYDAVAEALCRYGGEA